MATVIKHRQGPMTLFRRWLKEDTTDYNEQVLTRSDHFQEMRRVASFWLSTCSITPDQHYKLMGLVFKAQQEAGL
jgi:hypothetical protein